MFNTLRLVLRHPLFLLRPDRLDPKEGGPSQGEDLWVMVYIVFLAGVVMFALSIAGFSGIASNVSFNKALLLLIASLFAILTPPLLWAHLIVPHRTAWLKLGCNPSDYPQTELEWGKLNAWARVKLEELARKFNETISAEARQQILIESIECRLKRLFRARINGPSDLIRQRSIEKRVCARIALQSERRRALQQELDDAKQAYLAAWDLFRTHGITPGDNPKVFRAEVQQRDNRASQEAA